MHELVDFLTDGLRRWGHTGVDDHVVVLVESIAVGRIWELVGWSHHGINVRIAHTTTSLRAMTFCHPVVDYVKLVRTIEQIGQRTIDHSSITLVD